MAIDAVVLALYVRVAVRSSGVFGCEGGRGEGVGADVAGYDGEVGEVFAGGDAVDVLFLGG